MPTDGNGLLDRDSTLFSAARWIDQLLLGSIRTSIALIAVALLGFAMPQDRLSPHVGMRVALTCFIPFGAPLVAVGIVQATGTGFQVARGRRGQGLLQPPSQAPDFDPYVSASVPTTQRTWP